MTENWLLSIVMHGEYSLSLLNRFINSKLSFFFANSAKDTLVPLVRLNVVRSGWANRRYGRSNREHLMRRIDTVEMPISLEKSRY